MAISDADLWHQVHAQREDGIPTMFLVRDIDPRLDQPRIFVIEMPYPITDLSKLPDAASYRRLDTFQEQWVEPACEALGWTFVASKSADGSIFLYLYGDGDPKALLDKLAPFDGELGFFSDVDAEWSEYAALRELVDQAESADEPHVHTDACEPGHDHADETPDDSEDASDGVPVRIAVIDLSAAPPPPRKARERAKTVNLGKPITARKPARARPTARKPAASKAAASKPATSKAATSKSKQSKSKVASKPTKRAAATKPTRATTAARKPTKPTTRTVTKRSTSKTKQRTARR